MPAEVLDACVIIPHYAGEQLYDCLDAVYACSDQPAEVILVDDASVDGTSDVAAERFPGIRRVRNPENLGFVGSCNRGLAEAGGPYAVLLNDDAVPESGWLAACISELERDELIAAVQPKIVSAREPERFEYAGAAGGLMDRFAYPFALGRWFDDCELDAGQYDEPRDIFWASGVAMVVRCDVVSRIGGFDPAFWMHMEEIDWCWRARLAGYSVRSVPSARVRHVGAVTLGARSYRKMYLNHRNSYMMLMKNYSATSLLWAAPGRLAFELLTAFAALATGQFRRAAAALAGSFGVLRNLGHIRAERRRISAIRVRSDHDVLAAMYRGSIALRRLFGLRAPGVGA